MINILQRRRRQLEKKGHNFKLSRADGSASVDVLGYNAPPTSSAIDGGIPKQAATFHITNDEIAKNTDYKTPKSGDRLRDGERTYTLTDVSPVYRGSELTGWFLIASGGR